MRRGLARRLTCEGQGIGKDTASPFQTNRRRRNGFVSPFLYAEVNQASRTTGHMALVAGRHSASRWLVGNLSSSAFFPRLSKFIEANCATDLMAIPARSRRTVRRPLRHPAYPQRSHISSTSLQRPKIPSSEQSHRPTHIAKHLHAWPWKSPLCPKPSPLPSFHPFFLPLTNNGYFDRQPTRFQIRKLSDQAEGATGHMAFCGTA